MTVVILFSLIYRNFFLGTFVYYLLTFISCLCGIYIILKIILLSHTGGNKICLFCFGMGLIGFLNICFVGQLELRTLITIYLIYFPVSLWLIYVENEKIKINLKLWELTFLIVSFSLIINYFLSNNELLFINASRNYVSVYLTEFMFLLVFMFEHLGKRTPALYIIVYCFGCIAAKGRAGILTASIFLLLVFMARLIKIKNTPRSLMLKIISITVVMVSVLAILYNLNSFIVTFLGGFIERKQSVGGVSGFSKFINTFFSSHERLSLLETYFNSVFSGNIIKNVFVGIQTVTLSTQYKLYDGNAHNSYILVHASFGLIGLFYTVYGILLKIIHLIKEKHLELAFILIAFSFRSLTDSVFPEGFGIFIPLYCILSYITMSTMR